MKCPKCGKDNWRCLVHQSVNVEIDEEYNIVDNGFDFSDPELQKDTLYCDGCGFEAKEVK